MKIRMTAIGLSAFLLLLVQCGSDSKTGGASSFDEKLYLDKGNAIVEETFAELSGKLVSAIEEKGVSGAIEYCNIAAMPLVDSLSSANNATIRRTSFRVRNPQNAATNWERGVLAEYEAKHSAGEALEPVVKELDEGTVAFAAPIIMKPLCLKCHGEIGADIVTSDYLTIKRLYPNDEAFAFVDRQFRGMWSITFKK
ncbi:MAG: DUF3365 domain-containing protein [Saprospiraceae bacterium]